MSDLEAEPAGQFPRGSVAAADVQGRTLQASRSAVSGSRRRRLLVTVCLAGGDVVSGAAATAAATAASRWLGAQPETWLSPASLLLLISVYAVVGLYRASSRNVLERFRLRATAVILFVFAETLMLLHGGLSPTMLATPLAAGLALAFGSWAEHVIVVQLIRRGAWGAPTAILGTSEAAEPLARLLQAHPDWGLAPRGLIEIESLAASSAAAPAGAMPRSASLPVLGSLESWRPNNDLEVLAVTEPCALPCKPEAITKLGFSFVLLINQVGEIPTFGMQIRHFDRSVAIMLGPQRKPPSRWVKRAVDLTVTVPLALAAAPVIALLAAWVKIADPGSAFYGQLRVGEGGKPVRIIKLRTMYRDSEERLQRLLTQDPAARDEWQRYFKLSRDPRILPGIGHFLRRTSLDELPQLWNVIRGDMSLVGPRPFPSYHMDAFDPAFRALRVSVPPGLTGLWQVSSRSNGDLDVQRSQDCFYIRNRSLWLDLYILLATLPAVISAQGAK